MDQSAWWKRTLRSQGAKDEEKQWSGVQKMEKDYRLLGFWGYFVNRLSPILMYKYVKGEGR
jgi:hypothetical protein